MEDLSRESLTNMVLAVSGLCERTRELAVGEASGPEATALVRHAIQAVLQAVDVVESTMAPDASAAPLSDPPAGADASWLLGDSFS